MSSFRFAPIAPSIPGIERPPAPPPPPLPSSPAVAAAPLSPSGYQQRKARRRSNELIEDPYRRKLTFSKRHKGLLKKATELHLLTGANMFVVVQDGNTVRTWASPKMLPLVEDPRYLRMLGDCLGAPDVAAVVN